MDALKFIEEFKNESYEWLKGKGLTNSELETTHLDLQWRFLKFVLDLEKPRKLSFNTTGKFNRSSISPMEKISKSLVS